MIFLVSETFLHGLLELDNYGTNEEQRMGKVHKSSFEFRIILYRN